MQFIRQRFVTLQNRARGLQNTLRRWALYSGNVSQEMRGDLLARMTPAEQAQFETDQGLTRGRLRPVSTQIRTLSLWFDFVLQRINEQFERARVLLDQGRNQESLAIVNDVEARILNPHAETLAIAFRAFQQHAACDSHQRLAAIDALVRDLYLPTVKLANQRGLVSKQALARTPVAYFVEPGESGSTWRQHAAQAANMGRQTPISLLAVPSDFVAHPWNLAAVACEVGQHLYNDLDLSWEVANKLQTEAINAGVAPTATALWARWHEILFADLFGVLKLGPAYVSGMIELLGSSIQTPAAWRIDTPVPPTYIRWHIMLQALQLLSFTEEARDYANQVHTLCGDPNQVASRMGPQWLEWVKNCRAIAGLVAFSPCQRLGGVRVIDVVQPFLTSELQFAQKVRDLLVAGDESCVHDDRFGWAESVRDVNIPIAVAGLRLAFDQTTDYDTARRLWVRFWCLTQFLTDTADHTRDREDREFAPGEAELRSIALKAVPAFA